MIDLDDLPTFLRKPVRRPFEPSGLPTPMPGFLSGDWIRLNDSKQIARRALVLGFLAGIVGTLFVLL